MQSQKRTCKNCAQDFIVEQDDFGFYAKIGVPTPTRCPECRRQRRLSWRNDFFFYYRACDLCKKRVVSIYHPSAQRIVYCGKCWWSDRWNPENFARDYDFSRPFFDQFREFQETVPVPALMNDNHAGSVNSEYTQDFAFGKNCYMTFVSWKTEDCLYSAYIGGGKHIVDSMSIFDATDSVYESIFIMKAARCRNAYYSRDILNCAFVYDCRGCADCFMCIGLRNKKYCIKNKQYTKEEYRQILDSYRLDTYAGSEKAFAEFRSLILGYPREFAYQAKSVNVVGDDMIDSKNVHWGFNSHGAEDCRYIESCDNPKDNYDLCTGGECRECYESITPDQSHRDLFTIHCWNNNEVAYSEICYDSTNLLGCISMRYAENAILNKRYSRDEYKKLKMKIIEQMTEAGEWGEFFPQTMSPFGYNETIAQLHFPLGKEQALVRGFVWQDSLQFTKGKETLKPEEIPESIRDVSDEIVKEILACAECGRNYRLIPSELAFYRKMDIPIPRKCFFCRNEARFKFRKPFRLWHRKCQCAGPASESGIYANTALHAHNEEHCPNEFETSYAPDGEEIVYCRDCYHSEIT